MCPIRTKNQTPVDFVCVLAGETTFADLEKYTCAPSTVVVETFDHVQDHP